MTKHRRFQFRLRTFLAGTIVVAYICSLAAPLQFERRKLKEIAGIGGYVATEPRGHFFLRQFLGDAFAERAVYVHLNDHPVDDQWLSTLQGLKHIEGLSIKSENLTDEGLVHLNCLPFLRSLHLVDTQVTADGIQRLRDSVPSLRLVERCDSD